MHRATEGFPKIIAHRGASAHAPENTLSAFRMALDIGVDYIELDVHMSRDCQFVVIHDRTLDRTTDGTGAVLEKNFEELSALEAGRWYERRFGGHHRGLRIPLLTEVIALARDSNAGLYIEIKDPECYPPDLVSRLLALIHARKFEQRVVILSFDPETVKKVKDFDPGMRTAMLVDRLRPDPVKLALDVQADQLAPKARLVGPALIGKAHAAGLKVVVWTVNELKTMQRMLELGVDLIITNYPDRLRALKENRSL